MDKSAFQRQLGARIQARRKSFGLTQPDLAGDELTKSLISHAENGTTMPSV